FQPLRTSATKPSIELRRSTGSAARRIRTARGRRSTVLPEGREQLGDVPGVRSRREAHHRAAPERHLDQLSGPRQRRGRRYYLDRQKSRRRLGLRTGAPFGLLVEPELKGAERDVVLGAELLLLQAGRAELLDQLPPLLGTRSSHGPSIPFSPRSSRRRWPDGYGHDDLQKGRHGAPVIG